jgi:Dihydroorotate dehydrogenase
MEVHRGFLLYLCQTNETTKYHYKMNLSTSYLGLKLKNPIIVSSSSLTSNIESIKKCWQAGAGAIVLKSLFEEQITLEINRENKSSNTFMDYPEAQDYLKDYYRGNEIEQYVNLIREAKKTVDIPVIASFNCIDGNEWISVAKDFEKAGADALELNISIMAFDVHATSEDIEKQYVSIVKQVKQTVKIPVSIKIGNHFTNIIRMVKRLADNGAEGIVLFNRFYNPDIDIDNMKSVAGSAFSNVGDNSESLRWISIARRNCIGVDLSASTGNQSGSDVVKAILAGATTVQLCSTLYANGVDYIKTIQSDLVNWMNQHHFESVKEFRGAIMAKQENAELMERLQYLRRNQEM